MHWGDSRTSERMLQQAGGRKFNFDDLSSSSRKGRETKKRLKGRKSGLWEEEEEGACEESSFYHHSKKENSRHRKGEQHETGGEN